ncbi:MAG: MarR family transcriptional regulator [Pseudomonas sp.]|nr:MarR family transcriptional regulator [Pseudomonas sp.]
MYEQHRFGMQLTHLSRAWRAELDRRLTDLGLSQARWLVLLHLARGRERPTQGELASSVGVENPTLARLLDALEVQQLIERQADQDDRRVKKIVLTPSAIDLIDRIESIASDLRKEVFAGLSEQDIALCQSIQAHMLANLEKRHEA